MIELWKKFVASVKSQSAEWRIRCNTCYLDRSLKDAGGIRYGAYGKKMTLSYCPSCERRQMMVIYHPSRGPL